MSILTAVFALVAIVSLAYGIIASAKAAELAVAGGRLAEANRASGEVISEFSDRILRLERVNLMLHEEIGRLEADLEGFIVPGAARARLERLLRPLPSEPAPGAPGDALPPGTPSRTG